MDPTAQPEAARLEAWLAEGYATAYRTACLMTRHPAAAEEAVETAFLRAWRFRDALPAGDGHTPWLYRVLVEACRSAGETGPGEGDDPVGPTPLDRLPQDMRTVVVLRYWTGLSERDIATVVRRRRRTVQSLLHEARRRLAGDPSRCVSTVGEVRR